MRETGIDSFALRTSEHFVTHHASAKNPEARERQSPRSYSRHNLLSGMAAKYVAEYVAEHASPDPDVPLLTSNIIRAAIMKATGVNTAGTFITNVKKLALDLISGTVAAGYQKLHAYMVQLAEDNGGEMMFYQVRTVLNKSGSVKDGSHCNLLAAIAIVPQEDELNWTWFLKHLKSSSMGFDENATLFASDRDKGM
ncbi:hypothetical protein DYB37_010777 [Aphanomyces astaci]|uniref:MULE transposase domain-containing protein n=1 Tax=Aphanomyces astaci TaxID=112090 RepID=A0A397EJ06_APHAT|nr:hypothetical protein DYB31_012790 [Aphanomyces astaci]RHZ28237.1 hypothetical protein DYB37_010777 [Aphanomyces astaci]